MKVSIFGLGYVGVVTAACLARDGHEVICVDVNPNKVNIINSGNSPIIEPGLEDLLVKGIKQNNNRCTGIGHKYRCFFNKCGYSFHTGRRS